MKDGYKVYSYYIKIDNRDEHFNQYPGAMNFMYSSGDYSYYLYAQTPFKKIAKRFESQRNMNKFKKVIRVISDEEGLKKNNEYNQLASLQPKKLICGYWKFKEIYSSELILTENEDVSIEEFSDDIVSSTCCELVSSESGSSILRNMDTCVFKGDLSRILNLFGYDEAAQFGRYIIYNDESFDAPMPTDVITIDELRVFVKLFGNTMRV